VDVEPVGGVVFGYQSILKTLYKKGKLPSVKYGFYGDELTKRTVSVEHLRPRSKGGKTELCNLVLASANKNQERAARPLSEMLNWECVGRYLEQFRNVHVKNFNGNQYIEMILRTIRKILDAEMGRKQESDSIL
jgi:hypothetical protein